MSGESDEDKDQTVAAGAEQQQQAEQVQTGHVWSPQLICEGIANQRSLVLARSGLPDTHSAGLAVVKDAVDGVLRLSFDPPPLPARRPR